LERPRPKMGCSDIRRRKIRRRKEEEDEEG